MSWHRVSRKYHKWLMLLLGLQFVIWSLSGAYMVIFDIDYIHGDSLVVNQQIPIKSQQVNYSIAQLYLDYPQAEHIELSNLLAKAVYRFSVRQNTEKGTVTVKHLLSAESGQSLAPLNKEYAVNIAKSRYSNTQAAVIKVSFISERPPAELSARHLPVWRVDFDDMASPSFYISAQTGKLVTKRHTMWRLFDWMFSFHVMDYVEEDASNKLLFIVVLFSLLASIFGLVLTYFRVFKQGTNSNKQRKGRKQKERDAYEID